MSFRYFGYGSNMFLPKLRLAAPSARFESIGYVPGYILRFNKVSDDGSNKANIIKTGQQEDKVRGVIFVVDDGDRESLATSEGGYTGSDLSVSMEGGVILAKVYEAKATRINDEGMPYDWYKRYCQMGAEAYGILPEYIQEAILSVAAKTDPDEDRVKKHIEVQSRPATD